VNTFTAIGHILGSMISVGIIGFGALMFIAWEGEQGRKRRLEEAAIHLGVVVEDLEKNEVMPRFLKYAAEQYSSELLRNRISDFCGYIQIAWTWITSLLEVAILIGVAWVTFTQDKSSAVYAWAVVAIAFVSIAVNLVFSFSVSVLTGRYPGQAKHARKTIGEVIRERSGAA
jgi:hypothetical protein